MIESPGEVVLGFDLMSRQRTLAQKPAASGQGSTTVADAIDPRAAGLDQVKVYSGLEEDVFLAIVDEARRIGLKPVGHVPAAVYLEDAAVAGQRGSKHLFGFENVIARLPGEPVKPGSGGMASNARCFTRLLE